MNNPTITSAVFTGLSNKLRVGLLGLKPLDIMKYIFSFLLLFTYSIANSQTPLSAQKIRLLDSIATQDVPPNAPGIATAIIKDGKVIYEKYAGFADLADSSLITGKTRFNIASNGKQFTALAILDLAENEKLDLSDDVRKYLPTIFSKIKEPITVRSLLNHTSGIRDCYDLWNLQGYTWWEKSFSNKDVLALIEKQEALNFKPESDYLYSNTNYILLALVVEKISGNSFVAYTNALFKKLHMPNTSFESDHTKIRGKIARAYFNFGTWTTYNWIWDVCGDGNIFSTLDDQVEWEKIIQEKGTNDFNSKIILTSQQPIAQSNFKNYGYGLEFGKYKALDYVFHEGATGAWKATVIRFPSKNTTFITLTNTGKSIPYNQTRQMADVVFELKPDEAYLVTKPPGVGKYVSEAAIVGTYLTESDFVFQFEQKDSVLFLKRIGRNDVELEREADNIFHQKYDPAFKQEFTTNAEGALQVTAYYTDHAPYTLTKQTADFSNFDYGSLNGTFMNTETGSIITINNKTSNTYNINIAGSEDTSAGLLTTPRKLLVDNYTLVFEPEKANKISTVYLNGDRIRNVRFVRQH